LLEYIDVLTKMLTNDMEFPHPLDDIFTDLFEDISSHKDIPIFKTTLLGIIDRNILPYRDCKEGFDETIAQYSK
jgi:hypothetical protein